jgi:hypothetical protein
VIGVGTRAIMDIFSFINTLHKSPELLSGISLFFFKCEYISSLFIGELISSIKKISVLPVSIIDLHVYSLEQLKPQLETSFLGLQKLYIVKNIDKLTSSYKKEWSLYLKLYSGPHTIYFFDTDAIAYNKSGLLIIEIPKTVSLNHYKQLGSVLFNAQESHFAYSASKIFDNRSFITLDDACILLNYQKILGKDVGVFLEEWIDKIIEPERSLFTLSSLLFARQSKDFFNYLSRFNQYPPEFWVSFWADQVWQAYIFITRAELMNLSEAKKGITKLPFSFLNKDWRKHTVSSLSQAHYALYEVDYRLKNGAGNYGLDLWYYTFFQNI